MGTSLRIALGVIQLQRNGQIGHNVVGQIPDQQVQNCALFCRYRDRNLDQIKVSINSISYLSLYSRTNET